MAFFRFWIDPYGLHLKIAFFGLNFESKLNKDYSLAFTRGIRNNTVDGARLVFCDYDCHKLEHLIGELKYLQWRFKLSDAYIFKASQKVDSFHVMFLDKLNYKDFLSVMELTSCDDYYKVMPISNDYHSWVLRILPKGDSDSPKLIKVLKSKYQGRVKSLAHFLFLHYHHGVNNIPVRLDNNLKCFDIGYATLNFLKKKDFNNKTA